MKESLDEAKKQLKRIDHSVFVSLKYTRTVDVIKNILERMVNVFGFVVNALLKFAIEQKKITEFPDSTILRCELLKEIYQEEDFFEELNELINFFMLLRKINKIEDYEKINEYRRHVALITIINDKRIEVNLDEIHEYYKKTQMFINLAEEIIYGKEDD